MKNNKMRLTPFGRVLFCALLTPDSALFGAAEITTSTVPPFGTTINWSAVYDEHALLAAIAEVETGAVRLNRPCRKIGRHGERSAWQIKRSVWSRYTREPFAKASTDATLAHLVASLHLRFLRLELERNGENVTMRSLALAWNAGLTGMQHATNRQRDYADRVGNTYEARQVLR